MTYDRHQVVYDEKIDESDGDPPNDVLVLKIDLYHNVDLNAPTSDHRLTTTLKNAEFGIALGNQITGFRANAITAIRPVPEPSSLALLALGGLVGLVFVRRRK